MHCEGVKIYLTVCMPISYTEWYQLLCLEDNKQYCSTVTALETVNGLEIEEENLCVGDEVIWQYRGAPYKTDSLHPW